MVEYARNVEIRQRDNEYAATDVLALTLAATTDTCKITHPVVEVDSTAGAVTTFTLPNGKPGQLLVIRSKNANDVDVVPTTATGWSAIALDAVGDTAVLLYLNDTDGWIILSLISVAVDSSPAYTAA